jgi:hypothetical protein
MDVEEEAVSQWGPYSLSAEVDCVRVSGPPVYRLKRRYRRYRTLFFFLSFFLLIAPNHPAFNVHKQRLRRGPTKPPTGSLFFSDAGDSHPQP